MSATRKINKQCPEYDEYISKCKDLFNQYEEKMEAERAKFPNSIGLDHPAGEKIKNLTTQRNAELRILQQEYAYLFTEEPEDENGAE